MFTICVVLERNDDIVTTALSSSTLRVGFSCSNEENVIFTSVIISTYGENVGTGEGGGVGMTVGVAEGRRVGSGNGREVGALDGIAVGKLEGLGEG